MTYLEAIREDLRPYPIRISLIERKCEKYQIVPSNSAKNEKAVAKIVIEILVQMMTLNNVAEGGVSISFAKEGVTNQITSLCSQYEFDSSKYVVEPKVSYLGDV